ncbi:hypothetical protein C8F04DRAFT_1181026 [Mycena alexandri]|uniref:Uncharacterized protein n=1 Tax=Mycena alexandri TaxID=1745969 RepID=A0AAD6X678_9AGAR|nr:hypothetical protein C8F04DRAFT_1181026 [Mycena alexandri]
MFTLLFPLFASVSSPATGPISLVNDVHPTRGSIEPRVSYVSYVSACPIALQKISGWKWFQGIGVIKLLGLLSRRFARWDVPLIPKLSRRVFLGLISIFATVFVWWIQQKNASEVDTLTRPVRCFQDWIHTATDILSSGALYCDIFNRIFVSCFPAALSVSFHSPAAHRSIMSQVPCFCTTYKGRKGSRGDKARHEARDLRALSHRAPHYNSSAPAPSPLTPTAPPVPPAAPPSNMNPVRSAEAASPTTVEDCRLPPFPEEAPTPDFIALTEAAGLAHLQHIEASGECFLPLGDDDWEAPGDVDEDSVDGPAPAVDENDPDPFFYDGSPQVLPTAAQIHPNRAVYLIYMTVLWLHAQFHLPFRACSALLSIFALAFQAGGAPITPALRTTPSVIHQLGAEPSIHILPVCPGCLEVYAAVTPVDTKCTKCSHPLFPSNPTPSQQRNGTTPAPRPYLQFPPKSLAEQLATMLAILEIEIEIEESLGKAKSRIPGVWTNIFDGKVCQELPTADGSRFFFPSDEELAAAELRIGVTRGVDWFSYLRSQISASHTSCPSSYGIINILKHHRYRTANFILAGIMPGPKEANPDHCQRFLRPLVNELLRLWRDGVRIVTSKYPQGQLPRWLWIPQPHQLLHDVLDHPKHEGDGRFLRGERFPRTHQRATPRTPKESARDAFVKKYATRWSELHRLPYFNVSQMIVIGPMHNLFLGVVKTHFYHIWVQLNVLRKTKELRTLHAMLSKLKLPAKLGRFPSLIGEPAGGSLTADQWLYIPKEAPEELAQRRAREIAATLEAKKVAAAEARKNAAAQKTAGKRARKPSARAALWPQRRRHQQEQANSGTNAEDEARDNATPPNLHPDDPNNFLKLSSALKTLVQDTITEAELVRADKSLREYAWELVDVLYGSEVIRPNHHYAMHTSRCVRNHGPLHEFWTFLFERLNKVLKSYKTPNQAGGELEASFFREFQRTAQQSRLAAREPLDSELRQAVEIMARTVESAFSSAAARKRTHPNVVPERLAAFLRRAGPAPVLGSVALNPAGFLFDWVIVNNTRHLAASRTAAVQNPLIAIRSSPAPNASLYVGELQAIFAIDPGSVVGIQRFGYVRWLRLPRLSTSHVQFGGSSAIAGALYSTSGTLITYTNNLFSSDSPRQQLVPPAHRWLLSGGPKAFTAGALKAKVHDFCTVHGMFTVTLRWVWNKEITGDSKSNPVEITGGGAEGVSSSGLSCGGQILPRGSGKPGGSTRQGVTESAVIVSENLGLEGGSPSIHTRGAIGNIDDPAPVGEEEKGHFSVGVKKKGRTDYCGRLQGTPGTFWSVQRNLRRTNP